MRRPTKKRPRDTMGVVQLSRSFQIVAANEAVADLLGYSPEELTGMSIRDTWHASDAPFLQQNMRAASVGFPSRYRRRLRRADRSYVMVDVSLRRLRGGGFRLLVCPAPN